MKKTLATAATLLIMVSALSFANGNKENSDQRSWGPGNGSMGQNGTTNTARPFEQGEELTITGTLKLVANGHPELVTKDGTYELMYPYMYADDLKLKDGQKITVKGYDTPAYRWNNGSKDEKYLMVTEATIDGKNYKLDSGNFGPMGKMSGRKGRGNSRGGSRQMDGGRW